MMVHGMPQVQMGDVRLMLPCGDSQPAAGQEDQSPTSAGGPIAAERSNSAYVSGDLDLGQQAPNMLVVVLAGFQATSRTTEARVSQFASPGMTPQAILSQYSDSAPWSPVLLCTTCEMYMSLMSTIATLTHLHCKLGQLSRVRVPWCADVGVLAASSPDSGHRVAAATANTADVDKIKAEHMRSNSAMPALGAVKLGTKSSLLPSTAAEARQHATMGTATVPRSETAASTRLAGQATPSGPSVDASRVTGVCKHDQQHCGMSSMRLVHRMVTGFV